MNDEIRRLIKKTVFPSGCAQILICSIKGRKTAHTDRAEPGK